MSVGKESHPSPTQIPLPTRRLGWRCHPFEHPRSASMSCAPAPLRVLGDPNYLWRLSGLIDLRNTDVEGHHRHNPT